MDREGGLLRWQWSLYPAAHRDRRNLALHAATSPIFLAGTIALVVSPVAGAAAAIGGAAAMLAAMLAQGRGHKLEKSAPAPFLGPGDVVKRFFLEQWVTFPRYVLSGGFSKAWREAR
jgi:hypothetical protein